MTWRPLNGSHQPIIARLYGINVLFYYLSAIYKAYKTTMSY